MILGTGGLSDKMRPTVVTILPLRSAPDTPGPARAAAFAPSSFEWTAASPRLLLSSHAKQRAGGRTPEAPD